MKNLTLKQYFGLHNIKYKDIKTLSEVTICNIMRGGHDGAKHNKNYKGKFDYYPNEGTVIKLAEGLGISESETKEMIDNQLKSLGKELRK